MSGCAATTADLAVGDVFTIHRGNLAGRTFRVLNAVPGARALRAEATDRPTLAAIWRDDCPVTIHDPQESAR